ncbi:MULTISPECIES: FtsX-like permease family protein [unclassified Streptomyces]|uniref:FtsX-like permease family protein n=1 Tax=unclassified Streptomyces TaxID=2593676 RepID=UPI002E1D7B69|nr:ABC transporter permease [Streptomyces sp. NBC_01023]
MSPTQDLTMGMKFAVGGGREGWTRTLLTAVGVGLGVALLLFTTAIPGALAARNAREDNRNDFGAVMIDKPAHNTMLLAVADTVYKGTAVRGRLVRGEGPDAPLPPGTRALPGNGEMLVSPALRTLLASDKGALLRERLPYRITGTIADAGLTGPNELAYYAGDGHLTLDETGMVRRITSFAHLPPLDAMDPVLRLLVVITFVVLLMPVGVFIAAAVRFGSDSRDRRLAALRLVGTDSRMTRRIAAGEALAGSLLGVLFGAAFFLIGRAFVGDIDVAGINLFPADVNPSAALAVGVVLAVPAAAVAVTLFALRGVVIEPLGVVRTSVPRRRRVWWRVLLPVAGLALLVPMLGKGRTSGHFNSTLVISGSVLLLIGVTALLPWLIEAVVNRLGGSTVAWQLAVRRLQMTSGTAARLVNGIAVAVAGAIALQMLFAGIDGDYSKQTGADTSRAQMIVQSDLTKTRMADALRSTHGVRSVLTVGRANAGRTENAEQTSDMYTGDCASLRVLAALPSCEDGDAFIATGGWDDNVAKVAAPGKRLFIKAPFSKPGDHSLTWTIPARTRTVQVTADPAGRSSGGGVLLTPGALPALRHLALDSTDYISLDPSEPDAIELVRNSAAKVNPLTPADALHETHEDNRFASVRKGLYIGAAAVLLLIGASLLVSVLEQLRDRRKLLAALTAFGTRRSTMSWSVLWQTAVPVALGLLLATVVGLGLGAVLLDMVGHPVSVNWPAVAAMAGIGGGVVVLVTLLSLPPLWRLMRPEGLRTE